MNIMADNAAENIKAFNLEEFKEDEIEAYDDEWEDIELEDEPLKGLQLEEEDIFNEVGQDEGDALEGVDIEDVEPLDTKLLDDFIETEIIQDWKDASFDRLGCVAHALQLVVKDVLTSSKTSQELVKILNSMVSFFHKSNTWSELLVKKTKLQVVAVGKTRWNTVSIAMERLLKPNFVDHVNSVYMEAQRRGVKCPTMISTNTVKLMKELQQILKPIRDLTDKLQGDKVTSSSVQVGLICLNNGKDLLVT